MTVSLKRRCAELVCRALQRALPAELEAWGWAVRSEVAEITDDAEALFYALDSCRGILPRAAVARLLPLVDRAGTDALSPNSSTGGEMARNPRMIGIWSAVGAVLLGCAYMAAAGAPIRYLAINGTALLIGLVMLVIADRVMSEPRRWSSLLTIAAACALLATALLGQQIDGAARWIRVGPIAVQPGLILLPAMIVAFARSRDAISSAAMVVAAAGLALQPDRAMAGVLAASLIVLAARRPDRFTLTALTGSMAGFVAALVQVDALPAVPYVDQILYSSFDVHPLAGVAVLAGSLLLIIPAIYGWCRDEANRDVYIVFGAVWLGAILAAALGNYPTPLVGYGGSAIIGYALCLAVWPRLAVASLAADVQRGNQADAQTVDQDLRLGLPAAAS